MPEHRLDRSENENECKTNSSHLSRHETEFSTSDGGAPLYGQLPALRNRGSFKIIILCFLTLFISIPGLGEETPKTTLTGTVIDASDGKPLFFVNVFLASTTLGAATDSEGRFSIENVPFGVYELVVSMVGYERKIVNIRIIQADPRPFRIRLKPEPIQAPVLEVTARHPRRWRRNVDRFKKLFLGESHNATLCHILNPEILEFEIDRKRNRFAAWAEEPLHIENHALGYRATTLLIRFFEQNRKLTYIHKTKFDTMQADTPFQRQAWEQNRRLVYQGSLRHFLRSAVRHRLIDDGYIAYYVIDLDIQPDDTPLKRVRSEEIVIPGETQFEYAIAFPNYIRVTYTLEPEPREYGYYHTRSRGFRAMTEAADQQVSWVILNATESVNVDILGRLENPDALAVFGFWAWERFAEELPLDYLPKN